MSKTVRSFLFVVVALSLVLAACVVRLPSPKLPLLNSPLRLLSPPRLPNPLRFPTEEDPMAMYMPDAVTGDVLSPPVPRLCSRSRSAWLNSSTGRAFAGKRDG